MPSYTHPVDDRRFSICMFHEQCKGVILFGMNGSRGPGLYHAIVSLFCSLSSFALRCSCFGVFSSHCLVLWKFMLVCLSCPFALGPCHIGLLARVIGRYGFVFRIPMPWPSSSLCNLVSIRVPSFTCSCLVVGTCVALHVDAIAPCRDAPQRSGRNSGSTA